MQNIENAEKQEDEVEIESQEQESDSNGLFPEIDKIENQTDTQSRATSKRR